MHRKRTDNMVGAIHQEPEMMSRLFSSRDWSPLWIGPRLYVGWVWLSVGWSMMQSPGWMRDGSALRSASLAVDSPAAWTFEEPSTGVNLLAYLVDSGALGWIARLTAVGMTVAGIALILGIATGLAAFIGIVLSVNVMVTGSFAPGPEVVALAVLIVMAWKTAGWIGLDRWALPLAGAPWQDGFETGRRTEPIDVAYEGGERSQ